MGIISPSSADSREHPGELLLQPTGQLQALVMGLAGQPLQHLYVQRILHGNAHGTS